MTLFNKILKWAVWVLAGLGCIFILLVIIRAFHFYNLDKTSEQVAKIHNTKLELEDVMGQNLPPDPGEEADDTIPGIDANENGIRDDVELAIFNEYPDSAKTRAESLQYALALQAMTVQPFLDTEIATAIMQEKSRAYDCVGETLPKDDTGEYLDAVDALILFVDDKQLNTNDRLEFDRGFYEKVRSYSESEKKICDIDLEVLLD